MSEKIIENIKKSKSDNLNYRYLILKNGLKCLLISDPSTDKSAASVNVGIGHLSDPDEYPGLAHFIEHMLFMGTKKYPKESDFFSYINEIGGDSNAATDLDHTYFYFDSSNQYFEDALDKFSSFFICPLFNADGISREVKAVDSEHKKNYLNDSWRAFQLQLSECNPKSVLSKFGTGNLSTLDKPNIRDEMIKMYNTYYTSEIMHLCILTNKSLDEMQKVAENLFNQVPKNDKFVQPVYTNEDPFNNNNLGYFYKVVPIKDKDKIELSWVLENETPYYKQRPCAFLSDLFGHEGPNSLCSSLVRDGLISELVAGGTTLGKSFTFFSITVVLTKKGLENYKDVIYRMLKYVKIIQEKELNERFLKEVVQINQTKFDYKSKEEPIDYVGKLSTKMQIYPIEDLLLAEQIIIEYDAKLIEKYLKSFKLDNLNIYFYSKSVEKECTETEKWFGTKFSKVPLKTIIDEKLIDNYKCDHCLDYPPQNNFIPKNFDLVPFEEGKDQHIPTEIFKDEKCSIYYKKDDAFKLPKASCVGTITLDESISDFSYKEKEIISLLIEDIIKDELRETVYMAIEARCKFSLGIKFDKLTIEFQGFNDSLKGAIKEITNQFNKIIFDNKGEQLKNGITKLIQDKKNFYTKNGFIVAFQTTKLFLAEPSILPKEYVQNLTTTPPKIESIIRYVQNMFNKIKCEWIIIGNLKPEEAIEIGTYFHTNLKYANQPLPIENIQSRRAVKINDKSNYVYSFVNDNKEELTSSITSFFQFGGDLSLKQKTILEIIEVMLSSRFFEELRTKQALGYIVDLISVSTLGNEGILCVIQSNVAAPETLWKRINEFILSMKETVFDKLNDEGLKVYKESLLVKKRKKPVSLEEEIEVYFKEFENHKYFFERKKKVCEILESNEITVKDVVDAFNENFIDNVKRIDVEFVCQKHLQENEDELKENIQIAQTKGGYSRIKVNSMKEFKNANALFPAFYYIGIK